MLFRALGFEPVWDASPVLSCWLDETKPHHSDWAVLSPAPDSKPAFADEQRLGRERLEAGA